LQFRLHCAGGLIMCAVLTRRADAVTCFRGINVHGYPRRKGTMQAGNGVPADQLGAAWLKSTAGNQSGQCVDVAALADGEIAVRNSRHPSGPALVYTRAEIAAFLAG
jgi:hypothetical protein